MLVNELESRFPAQNVLQAMGILYPQYWLAGDCESTFEKHLRILIDHYGQPKIIGKENDKIHVPALVDPDRFVSQQGLFKLAMRSNARSAMEPPFDVNPLTRI
jgi:hypothetical protein